MTKCKLNTDNIVENTLGKGENAGYQHFLLFQQYFQKSFLLGVINCPDCVVRVKAEQRPILRT